MIELYKNTDLSDIKGILKDLVDKGSKNPTIRELATQVTPQHDEDQIAAIYDYVKENIKYQPDPYRAELFIAPWKMIELIGQSNARGDCDDMALFCTSLYQSLGIPSRLVLVDTGGKGIDHAICEVYSDKLGEWVTVDIASSKPLGWKFSYYDRIEVK